MAFIPTFRENQNRQSNYRQWSERATIIAYDAATKSYDIVITAMGPTGTQVSNTNRSLRRVKSLFPDSVGNFSPGDSVLVGYVSEQREHPIILGAGDHVAPTINTPIVRLPTSTESAQIQGPSSGITSPTQNQACPPRVTIGGLTGATLTIKCSQLSATREFSVPVSVLCTSGLTVTWSWNFPDGIVIPFGTNYTSARLKFPTTSSSVLGTAYRRDFITCGLCGATQSCFSSGQVAAFLSDLYGCNDDFIAASTISNCGDGFSNSVSIFTFTCCPGSCIDPSLNGPPRNCPTGHCVEHMCDQRTAPMIAAGCKPCALAQGSVLTATLGQFSASININVTSG